MKILILLCSALLSVTCHAREIKIVVPYSPGGATDQICRLLEAELSNKDYNFTLEYKIGAGGAIAANYVAGIKNNTVLFVPSNNLITAPLLSTNTTYDISKSFVLVDYIGAEPLLLLVNNNNSIKNYQDLIEQARYKSLPYGSAGVGTSSHISAAIIANNHLPFIHIPFKGGASALSNLLGENIKWMVDSDSISKEFILTGKIKPIAVVSKNRMKKYPNVPTLSELGVNDYGIYRWFVVVANSDADPMVLNYVKDKINTLEFKEKIKALGIDTGLPPYFNQFFVRENIQTKKMLQKIKLE
jgi:tripartite-type tricarboxylate transporter receptor subunit TctC